MRRRSRGSSSSRTSYHRPNKKEREANLESSKIIARALKLCFKNYYRKFMYQYSERDETWSYYGNQLFPTEHNPNPTKGMLFASFRASQGKVYMTFMPCVFNPEMMQETPATLALTHGDVRIWFDNVDQVNKAEISLLIRKGIIAWKQRNYIV